MIRSLIISALRNASMKALEISLKATFLILFNTRKQIALRTERRVVLVAHLPWKMMYKMCCFLSSLGKHMILMMRSVYCD